VTEPQIKARSRRRERGQSVIEFALILPVFLVLLGAAIDLGRIEAARVSVANAAREGAFQAAQTPTDFVASTTCPSLATTNLVMCRTLLEAKSGSFVAISPADVSLSCSAGCTSGMGNTVTVSVTGHFTLLTPLLGVFFGGNNALAFTASSTQQIATLPIPPTPPPVCATASFIATDAHNGGHPHRMSLAGSINPSSSGWTWTWSGGLTASGQIVTNDFPATGLVNVTLTASKGSCTVTFTHSVNVP